MLTRRSALAWLAASPVAIGLERGAIARARDHRLEWGQVYRGEERVDAPATGTWLPTTEGYHVSIVRRIKTWKPRVFSISNANDRYAVWVELAHARTEFLVLPDGTATRAVWVGGGGPGHDMISFEVSTAHAIALAAEWGVAVKQRTQLGAGLVGHWRTRRHLVDLGDPIEIELEVENTGPDPAYLAIGSFARWAKYIGPRDNRFAFTASADWLGREVQTITADSRGGLGIYETIRPGASFTDAADLRSWAVIDRSGVYAVECRFRSGLVADPRTTAGWPDHGHEAWDLELCGSVLARVE